MDAELVYPSTQRKSRFTLADRRRVLELTSQGYGYGRIAEEMDIREVDVKKIRGKLGTNRPPTRHFQDGWIDDDGNEQEYLPDHLKQCTMCLRIRPKETGFRLHGSGKRSPHCIRCAREIDGVRRLEEKEQHE